MIKTISIYYWHLSNPAPDCLPWEHGDVIKSKSRKKYRKKLMKIIGIAEAADHNIKIQYNKSMETATVYIDKGRFKQC